MTRAFRSEMIKMRRWSTASAFLFMVGFTSLGIVLAVRRDMQAHGNNGFLIRFALISPQGIDILEGGAASIVIAIALITVGANVAAEWSQGTLRSLLVREAGRVRMLTGKFLALTLYLVVSATITLVIGVVIALPTAHAYGLDTSLWSTSAGVGDWFEFLGNVLLALVGWCLMGLLFAVATRSVAGAIGAVLTYALAVEGLLSGVLPDVAQWLPGHIFADLATGGTPTISYSVSLVLTAAYSAGFAAVSAALFAWRDVVA